MFLKGKQKMRITFSKTEKCVLSSLINFSCTVSENILASLNFIITTKKRIQKKKQQFFPEQNTSTRTLANCGDAKTEILF